MTLNAFRDEADRFLLIVDPEGLKSESEIFAMLDEEYFEMKKAGSQLDRLKHQVYDMLFLLFELAAKFNFDLDTEWELGREKNKVSENTIYKKQPLDKCLEGLNCQEEQRKDNPCRRFADFSGLLLGCSLMNMTRLIFMLSIKATKQSLISTGMSQREI